MTDEATLRPSCRSRYASCRGHKNRAGMPKPASNSRKGSQYISNPQPKQLLYWYTAGLNWLPLLLDMFVGKVTLDCDGTVAQNTLKHEPCPKPQSPGSPAAKFTLLTMPFRPSETEDEKLTYTDLYRFRKAPTLNPKLSPKPETRNPKP